MRAGIVAAASVVGVFVVLIGVVVAVAIGRAGEVGSGWDASGPAWAEDADAAAGEPVPTVPAVGAAAPAGIAGEADAAWVARVASRTGIPPRALAAYAGASLVLAREQPGCGVSWATLAAIGRVETGHGTHGGSAIDADGVARPRIVGPPLSGGDTLVVRDTDGGALDGDDRWDRAVGPMQFIPETWRAVGRDGSGDGVADINQIDDAALSAGVYLCRAGGDLTTTQGWIDAVHAYNPNVAYNNRVAAAADRYAADAG